MGSPAHEATICAVQPGHFSCTCAIESPGFPNTQVTGHSCSSARVAQCQSAKVLNFSTDKISKGEKCACPGRLQIRGDWSVLGRSPLGKRSEESSPADCSSRMELCTVPLALSMFPHTYAGRLLVFLAGLSPGLDRNLPLIQQPGLHIE